MIDIAFPLDEDLRQQAGLIFYEGFRRKLQPLIGKPAQTTPLLAVGLNLDMILGALVDGELLGVAGLHSQERTFLRVLPRQSLASLGLVRGPYAWAVLNRFGVGPGCPPGYLRIAALAVDASARGQRVGTRLLEAVFDQARREGFRAVRLEVVDTNTGARRLYERLGFVVVKTLRYPLVRPWLGFSADHVMVKEL